MATGGLHNSHQRLLVEPPLEVAEDRLDAKEVD